MHNAETTKQRYRAIGDLRRSQLGIRLPTQWDMAGRIRSARIRANQVVKWQGDFPTEQIALIVSERIAIDAN
jgi:hypothetical protein